jgi:hypothetical protein
MDGTSSTYGEEKSCTKSLVENHLESSDVDGEFNTQDVWFKVMDWISLVQDTNRWQTIVNAVINYRVPSSKGNFSTNWGPVSFTQKFLPHGISHLMFYTSKNRRCCWRFRYPVKVLTGICLGRLRKSTKIVSMFDIRAEICITHVQGKRFDCYRNTNLLSNYVTYPMERNPLWEANTFSASQKIPTFYATQRFINAFIRASPYVRIFRQINPFHVFSLIFIMIHYNIILPSVPMSSKWPFSVSGVLT